MNQIFDHPESDSWARSLIPCHFFAIFLSQKLSGENRKNKIVVMLILSNIAYYA